MSNIETLALSAPDDTFVDSVIKPKFDVGSNHCTLKPKEEITDDELSKVMLYFLRANSFTNWAIGDIGVEMDRRNMTGVTKKLCQSINKHYQTVSKAIRVCKRVPPSKRYDNIDYTTYAEIFTSTKIPDSERDAFLDLVKNLRSKEVRIRLDAIYGNSIEEFEVSDDTETLGLQALAYAPVNENGVVFLFAAIADKLGFRVIHIQSAFPDCIALRLTRAGRKGNISTQVKIEFEYRSSNFFQHKHDYRQCNYIVCWEDDTPNPPASIEIIELKKEIDFLRRSHPKLFKD